MAFLVSNNGWEGWYTYQWLQWACNFLLEQTNKYEAGDEEADSIEFYQSDSPYAEYITGYNTDSYADTLCDIIPDLWESYLEECEEENRTPTWDDGWNNYIWTDPDYQQCHTWLRVTNIQTESDEEIRQLAKDCDYSTMEEELGLNAY